MKIKLKLELDTAGCINREESETLLSLMFKDDIIDFITENLTLDNMIEKLEELYNEKDIVSHIANRLTKKELEEILKNK